MAFTGSKSAARGGEGVCNLVGAVGAAVVNYDDFEVGSELSKNVEGLFDQWCYVAGFIVAGEEYAY
jgi:hypothetical protein